MLELVNRFLLRHSEPEISVGYLQITFAQNTSPYPHIVMQPHLTRRMHLYIVGIEMRVSERSNHGTITTTTISTNNAN